MSNDKLKEKRDAMVAEIVKQIEANPLQWEQGWINVGGGITPHNAITVKNYNGFNFLYLYFKQVEKGYDDGRWLTFKQIQDLGGKVKKGAEASSIFYFRQYDKNTKKDFDTSTIKGLTKDEQYEYVRDNVVPILRYSNVFNACQCENLPEAKKTKQAMTEVEIETQRTEIMETILKNNPVKIEFDGGNRAYYKNTTDEIHLPVKTAFLSMQDYYATALHEIAHSTGHKSRLNRDLSGSTKEAYAIEELRAELSCVFIQNELGVKIEGKHFKNHVAYLQSWLQEVKKDPNVFLEAVSSAGKIADYISQNYAKQSQGQDTIKATAQAVEPKPQGGNGNGK